MKAQVMIPGNIGKKATLVHFENGRSVLEFSVATNSFYYNSEGEKVEETEWHQVKKFVKNPSDQYVKLFEKGAAVVVTGDLTYKKWTKEVQGEEVKMTSAIIEADDIKFF